MSETRLQPAVVLVADRTLSARYNILFEGMFATMQTTHTPDLAMRYLLAPKVRCDGQGRATLAPLGLRRVQASLAAGGGLGLDDVVCTTPEQLESLLGPWVKLVLVSSSDPLGMGMSNTTTSHFWSGELYTRVWTDRMMRRLAELKRQHGFQVIGGGGGAWQYAWDRQAAARHGIDCIFEGYFESHGPELVAEALRSGQLPDHYAESGIGAERIRPIRDASIFGIVEWSRGCGKGCVYCSMGRKKMEHLPAATILADIQTNVARGVTNVVSGSEDFFRYGATGPRVNFEALRDLLTEVRRIDGLSFMQIDHGNIASVMQYEDSQLREIRELLRWKRRCDYLWVNMGIESANGHLVRANSPAKLLPFEPDNWEALCLETADKMKRCGFFPVFSVILGLPGETPEDVRRTVRLVRQLAAKKVVIFPIFYEPILDGQVQGPTRFTLDSMTLDHLDLYETCYELNFREVPGMFWDNQRAGGVPWGKRALINLLGNTEVWAWRSAFKRLRREITARGGAAGAKGSIHD